MTTTDAPRSNPAAFGGGAIIGALGGLIGLGGAEFRLPLLIGMFGFGPLEAVILNKAMSLVVVASALPFRMRTVPFGDVAALLGVARGELLIPTLILLFGADIKLAGSLSLAVSLPTMFVGFTRYSRDQNFAVIARNRPFLLTMAAGSVVGTFVGGQLLGLVPTAVLLPALACILLISAVKV